MGSGSVNGSASSASGTPWIGARELAAQRHRKPDRAAVAAGPGIAVGPRRCSRGM